MISVNFDSVEDDLERLALFVVSLFSPERLLDKNRQLDLLPEENQEVESLVDPTDLPFFIEGQSRTIFYDMVFSKSWYERESTAVLTLLEIEITKAKRDRDLFLANFPLLNFSLPALLIFNWVCNRFSDKSFWWKLSSSVRFYDFVDRFSKQSFSGLGQLSFLFNPISVGEEEREGLRLGFFNQASSSEDLSENPFRSPSFESEVPSSFLENRSFTNHGQIKKRGQLYQSPLIPLVLFADFRFKIRGWSYNTDTSLDNVV